MQLKLSVLAVREACYLIGLQWRNQQQLARFAQKQAEVGK